MALNTEMNWELYKAAVEREGAKADVTERAWKMYGLTLDYLLASQRWVGNLRANGIRQPEPERVEADRRVQMARSYLDSIVYPYLVP